MTSNEKCQGCERYILNQRGEYHCMLGECVVEKAKNMPILDKLYARYEASMVTYYDTGKKIFEGEANAYKDCYELVKPIVERLETINKVWHENEPMESVDINANHLQELYDFINKLIQ